MTGNECVELMMSLGAMGMFFFFIIVLAVLYRGSGR